MNDTQHLIVLLEQSKKTLKELIFQAWTQIETLTPSQTAENLKFWLWCRISSINSTSKFLHLLKSLPEGGQTYLKTIFESFKQANFSLCILDADKCTWREN